MLRINGKTIKFKKFPQGELIGHMENLEIQKSQKYSVVWLYEDESELVQLIYLSKHIVGCGGILENLMMPYLPNSRMDRVKSNTDIFTLKYFSEIINWLNFSRVITFDAHSDVCLGMIDRIANYNTVSTVNKLIDKIGLNKEGDVLFFPDNGAAKRYSDSFKFPYIVGNKKRDWKTGKIEGLEVVGNIPDKEFDVLIIDDICSRGGTFYYSAKALKHIGARNIYLYITHCENTVLDGDLINSGLIKKIYTTNSIFTKRHELIEVFGEF